MALFNHAEFAHVVIVGSASIGNVICDEAQVVADVHFEPAFRADKFAPHEEATGVSSFSSKLEAKPVRLKHSE